ncbi:MAG: HAD-IB family hydrolase [Actinomycetota bacterium]
MATAAVFDLDRTLISGSSAEIFGAKLSEVGVETPSVPGQSLLFRFYERFGEDPISMRLARQSARLFAGRRRADVEAAALLAADVLASRVLPHARSEIERHKASGALLVLATTSPYDLVAPFGRALGFDEVLSTRYRAVHGVYDGTIDGAYLWGRDKAAAVAAWAGEHAVDLTESWAYSDSWYDVPLLELVGHPVAVNPDLRLQAVARTRRWTARDFERPDGVPAVAGLEGQELAFPFFDPKRNVFADITIRGARRIPRRGPVILAANHRSYFDPLALGYLAAAIKRPLRFLAKKEVLETPVIGQVTAALGTISVDRGSGSSAPLDAAAAALEGGEVVVILPQGTIPRGEAFFKATLRGHTGAVRLAQRTGAPLVPVGLWGTEQVWPRNQRLPRLDLLGRPDVSIDVGEPYIVTARSKPRPATEKLMRKIQQLLPDEAQRDATPSEEELAATFPTSHQP